MNDIADYLDNVPTLKKPIHWRQVSSQFKLGKVFDEALVSNISMIPFIGSECVVMQLDDGRWELPGGTMEPGESYLKCLRREMLEELGAEISDFEVFGYFYCFSSAEEPYRPHIPHPNFIRLICLGEVRIVSGPLNPTDGEKVVAVEAVSIDEAVKRFEAIGRFDIADLYRLAYQIKESRSDNKSHD
ncbi:NUDIX hydrolase [Paenibacillus fonticola]|uniref:NUDIX hydrolase n=1 Tax=Paenibacillus fonticola TaxID=379896 RepID=UPI0003655303|nr:NUDIX hydrolase [Paenibacillus fonticola]